MFVRFLSIKLKNTLPSKSFKNVSKSKYLTTKIANQNHTPEEIWNRLNLRHACYGEIQHISILAAHLLRSWV
jgi:hypothetical protein